MAAQLAAAVYVTDPDTHQTVELAEGTSPEPHLAALVTNPAAWIDGKLPRLPKAKAQTPPNGDDDGPPAGDPDGASGDASGDPADSDETAGEPAAPAANKTAAKKTTAAPSRSRGREAAGKATSGE